MFRKAQEFQIDPSDIFKNDKLGRKNAILNLTNLINNSKDGFVLSINASWGNGKTTFIKLWEAYLKQQEVKTISFSAWEHDFSKEPLLMLLKEIMKEIKPNADKKEKLKKLAIGITKLGMNISTRIATCGILGSIDFINNNDLKDIINDTASESIDYLFENLNAEVEIREKFRAVLEEIVEQENNKKLVIFIDELDRCRPTYAIEMLEAIKHFFGTKNIVFVLALAKQELGISLSTIYGTGMDTEGYLKRFIDINYDLASVSKEAYIQQLTEYSGFEEQAFIVLGISNIKDFINIFTYLLKIFDFSLREIEHYFAQISITIGMFKNSNFSFVFFILMSVLKIKRHDLYIKLIDGKISAEEIIKLITLANPTDKDKYILNLFENHIMGVLAKDDDDFNRWLNEKEVRKELIIRGTFGDTCYRLYGPKTLQDTVNRINFLENITI